MSTITRMQVTDPDLARITRVRYISDPGFPMWDFSYANGQDMHGNEVSVIVPAELAQIPKRYKSPAGYYGPKAAWIHTLKEEYGVNPWKLLKGGEFSRFDGTEHLN